jgi:hypothetical protein
VKIFFLVALHYTNVRPHGLHHVEILCYTYIHIFDVKFIVIPDHNAFFSETSNTNRSPLSIDSCLFANTAHSPELLRHTRSALIGPVACHSRQPMWDKHRPDTLEPVVLASQASPCGLFLGGRPYTLGLFTSESVLLIGIRFWIVYFVYKFGGVRKVTRIYTYSYFVNSKY